MMRMIKFLEISIKLEVIDIFNDDASLNSFGLHYKGKDRFVARKEVAKRIRRKRNFNKN